MPPLIILFRGLIFNIKREDKNAGEEEETETGSSDSTD